MSKIDTAGASVSSRFQETKNAAKGFFCSLVLLMAFISQPAFGATASGDEGAEGAGGAGAGGAAAAGGIAIGSAVAVSVRRGFGRRSC